MVNEGFSSFLVFFLRSLREMKTDNNLVPSSFLPPLFFSMRYPVLLSPPHLLIYLLDLCGLIVERCPTVPSPSLGLSLPEAVVYLNRESHSSLVK